MSARFSQRNQKRLQTRDVERRNRQTQSGKVDDIAVYGMQATASLFPGHF